VFSSSSSDEELQLDQRRSRTSRALGIENPSESTSGIFKAPGKGGGSDVGKGGGIPNAALTPFPAAAANPQVAFSTLFQQLVVLLLSSKNVGSLVSLINVKSFTEFFAFL
jgi:hypothetical protein